MKIAFWNINTGLTSWPDRLATLKAWCLKMDLDLLLLEEVGNTLRADITAATGMEEVAYVNTLDINGKESTKQLWALRKLGSKFVGRAITFPDLDQKRMLVKVTNPDFGGFELWVIHANASSKGGADAVTAVNAFLVTVAGNGAIVGGDFNCPIDKAGARAIKPLSWQANDLYFTQWDKEKDATTVGPDDKLHLAMRGVAAYQKVLPHNIIDYVMVGDKRKAKSINNCLDESIWLMILKNFDHCPVVYTVS